MLLKRHRIASNFKKRLKSNSATADYRHVESTTRSQSGVSAILRANMISINERTAVGSIGVIETESFVCYVSTSPGFLRGTIAIFSAKPDGQRKSPPVAKAYLARGLTGEQREQVHNYIMAQLDEVGEKRTGAHGLASTIEGVFTVAKAQGMITKYIINPA
jgi:hypothetical protein